MSNGFLLAANADLPDLREIADGFGLELVSAQTFSTDAAAASAMQGAANVGIVLTHAATRDAIYVGLLQALSRTLRTAQLILEDPSLRSTFGFLPDAWPAMALADAQSRALDLLRRRSQTEDAGTPHAHPLPPIEPETPTNDVESEVQSPTEETSGAPEDSFVFLQNISRDQCKGAIEHFRADGAMISLDPETLSPWGDLRILMSTATDGTKTVVAFWTPVEPPERADVEHAGEDPSDFRDMVRQQRNATPFNPERDLAFQSGDEREATRIINEFTEATRAASTDTHGDEEIDATTAPSAVDSEPSPNEPPTPLNDEPLVDSFGGGGDRSGEETTREPGVTALPPQTPQPAPAPPPRTRNAPVETAPADATAFAPKKLRRGTPELVRIVIHQPQDLKTVIKDARDIDPTTNPAPSGMRVGDVALGSGVSVMLEVRGASCNGELQRRTWTGQPIDFNFSAEADDDVKQAVFLARVFVNDAQIGVLAFTRPIGGPKTNAASAERVRLKRHKRVFLSYSSKDRETVSAIATAYEAAGVEHFFDRTSLKSGEEWSPRLRREIERADLFHLCWSKSAASSEWVEKEAEHALTRHKRSNGKKPEITVQMLDGPPWAPHPRHLDSINFDDFVRAAIVGYARGDGSS